MAPSLRPLELFASTYVLEETRRNISTKVPHVLSFFEEFLSTGVVRIVDPDPALVLKVARVVVDKDAPVVAGAIAARTSFLAS